MQHYYRSLLSACLLFAWFQSYAQADTIDNYQIYIGNSLILTEASFNPLRSTVPVLRLDSSNFAENLIINLSHCTYSASNRFLKLTDTAGTTVMTWQFGSKEGRPLMTIPISEILLNPQIKRNSFFGLYYEDKEYPHARWLTSVAVGKRDFKKEKKIFTSKFDTTTLLYGLATLAVISVVIFFLRKGIL